MKKLLIAALAVIGFGSVAHGAPIWGTVQIGTTTTLTPTLQNGAINISSGSIRNLRVPFGLTVGTITSSGITTSTVTSSSANFTNASISTVNVIATFQLNSQSGTAGQSIQSNGSGNIPTWVNVPSAILSTSSTWTANQTISSANVTTLNVSTIAANNGVSFNLVGTTTNNGAPPGDIGEYMNSTVGTTSYGASGATVNFATITLTAGDWDVSAMAQNNSNGATVTEYEIGICVVSQTLGSLGDTALRFVTPATAEIPISIPIVRSSLSGTTTIYLCGESAYSVATPRILGGNIRARRVR